MAKFIQFQTSKILSAYGGVGSIIETPIGAVKIEEFDKWRFFKKKEIYEQEIYELKDNRLLHRLKHNFPRLLKLIRIPTNAPIQNFQNIPQDKDKVVGAKYFPEWFYCNFCESFKHIDDWWNGWNRTLKKYNFGDINKIRNSFIPPKCYLCNDKKILSKKKRYLRFELEQVRFIMTSPSGEICDIPWELWPTAFKAESDDGTESENIKLNEVCCDNQNLKYKRSTKFADMAGIRIECTNCPNRKTLTGLFGLKHPAGSELQKQFKAVIRTSNSVYYPLLLNSIFLPKVEEMISESDKKLINDNLKTDSNINLIFDFFKSKYSREMIEKYIKAINENNSNDFEDEISYRLKEYQFIKGNPNFTDNTSNNLTYENQNTSNLSHYGVYSLINIKRLKLTTVQVGYTRQNPFDKDNLSDENEIRSKLKYTSSKANQTEFLPAIESYGEGIFIEFDKTKIDEWFNRFYNNDDNFKNRLTTIQQNENISDFITNKRFQESHSKYLAKFLLLHTFSHILIKELEFLCGYPASSLSERLYIDNENMQGILIYTIAGFEGSYGGLISQGNPEKFEKIMKSALQRAQDCSSDPVCYNSDGQGIGGLNLAACYSCSLLPETSCEEFNCFLDRSFIIDNIFGFIK